MEFIASGSDVKSNDSMLSKDEFSGLSDEKKLIYFAEHMPPLEKRILLEMLNTSKTNTIEEDDKNNILGCVSKCYCESEFDVSMFQNSVTNFVVKRATLMAHAIWSDIFASLSTEQAKLMVKSGLINMKEANPDIDINSTSLTYGEVDFFSFANILERANPQPGESFVDLGHGTGKGIICANLLYGNVLSKCYGVEIIPELYDASVMVLDRFRKNILCMDEFDNFEQHAVVGNIFVDNRACEMRVDLGDITDNQFIDIWTSADIVFMNSTCFEDSLIRRLGLIAEKMRVGSRFISLTKQLPSSKFKLLDRRQYVMSWGEATCFTMLRMPD